MITQDFNLQTSTKGSKVMAFYGEQLIRSKIVMNDQLTEQA